jgi:predicted DNA binding CopG/RHH family protein
MKVSVIVFLVSILKLSAFFLQVHHRKGIYVPVLRSTSEERITTATELLQGDSNISILRVANFIADVETTVKDRELEFKQKELEFKQRELEFKQREFDILTTAQQKEFEVENLKMQVLQAEKDIMAMKQTLTARGLLEYLLKAAKLEMGLKGNFNAADTSNALQNIQQGKVLAWRSKCLLDCANTSGIDIYTVYSELSQEIHGTPWSGPSLRVKKEVMHAKTFEFIICLAKQLGFDIEA